MPNGHSILAENESKNVFLFSYLSFILIGLVNTFLGPMLPFLSEKWAISDAQGGYFLAAQSLGGMSGTLIASVLYARFDSRRILFFGFGLLIISLFGIGGGSWEIGLSASLASGIAIGFIIPTTTLIISQTAREKRAARINLLNFFWASGAILSPLIFLRLSSSIQLNFLLIIIAFAAIIYFGFLFKQPSISLVEEKKASSLNWLAKLKLFASNWIFAATIFLTIGIEASLSGWLPSYAERFTNSKNWLVVPLVYWTGFLLSRLLSPLFLRKLDEKTLILYGLILLIGGQILILSAEANLFLISFGAILTGFGASPIFPTTIAMASAKFERKAPELISYLFLLAGLSGMLFVWLVGSVASSTDSLKTALLIPIICGVILFLLHFLKRFLGKNSA